MKRIIETVWILCVGLLIAAPVFAEKMSNEELLQELKALKAKVTALEAQLKDSQAPSTDAEKAHTVQDAGGIPERVRKLEEKVAAAPSLGKWGDNITVSGVVEVEAGFENMKFAAPGAEDEDSSDIALATVELGIDADITKHVKGHVLLLWEEDDTEPVDLDEAYITFDGEDVVPLYLTAGKMYVPFGRFESHFVSDPLTLELGETRESAVQIGFANAWADLSLAVFNGDIDETGDDDHIKSFVGNATFTLPEGHMPDIGITMGCSFISNIGDSDGLEGEIANGDVSDSVAGFGAFISAAIKDRFFIEAEYLGALDEFEAGELTFDGGQKFKPITWNVEVAAAITDALEAAIKCEGGQDLGDLLPEIQYGATISYSIFENTSLALEYLYGEFENEDERNLVTAQLAIEF